MAKCKGKGKDKMKGKVQQGLNFNFMDGFGKGQQDVQFGGPHVQFGGQHLQFGGPPTQQPLREDPPWQVVSRRRRGAAAAAAAGSVQGPCGFEDDGDFQGHAAGLRWGPAGEGGRGSNFGGQPPRVVQYGRGGGRGGFGTAARKGRGRGRALWSFPWA